MRKRQKPRQTEKKRLDGQTTRRLSPAKIRDKLKRGRRTIEDRFLIGARNSWLSFFEKVWHEIGWQLLQIREQRSGTADDIRAVFEPIRGKPENHCADSFLRGEPDAAPSLQLRANRFRATARFSDMQKLRSQQQEQEYTSAYAQIAATQAQENEKEIIESEARRKKAHLEQLNEKVLWVEIESDYLDKKVREQETHLYCSELLGFLCKGKYAVKPLPLANSLAGLPQMGWRQSLARCSKMPRSSAHVQYPYGILVVISKIWKRRSKQAQLTLVDLFQGEIPKLGKKDGEARTYLSEGWRDLRMAIEECSKAEHRDDFRPYAITRAFMKNRSRLKTQADQILDEHDKLAILGSRSRVTK